MLMVSSAAAALASRYYKLDADKTKVALTYAACNATDPANSYYDYSQEFKYHNGASAQMGIMACELAKGGWDGWADPYFGHWGLVTRQVKDGKPLPELYEKAFEGLGQVWYTEESFKRGQAVYRPRRRQNAAQLSAKKLLKRGDVWILIRSAV